jgi:hypothetical protein
MLMDDVDYGDGDSLDAAKKAVELAEEKLSKDLGRVSQVGEATVDRFIESARPILIAAAVIAGAASVAAFIVRAGRRPRASSPPREPSLAREMVRTALVSLAAVAARRYGERLFAAPARAARRGISAAALALLFCLSPHAGAQTKLAVDVGAAFPSGAESSDGWGAGLRFGREYRVTLLTLTPELDVAYHNFGQSETEALRVLGGGRLGIDAGLEPSVFAHAGVGHYAGPSTSHTSLGYDIGLALDLTLLPVISFGPHVMFAGIAGTNTIEPLSWFEVGGHASFSFGD